MRLGVVVPCRRQEEYLPRTLAALERALAGREWRGALVTHGDAERLPARSAHWQVVALGDPGGAPLPAAAMLRTPGAARMRGFRACGGDWVFFVDADVEVEPAWVERAIATAEEAGGTDGRLAGLGGRLEEWFVDGRGERPGDPDLLRVGRADRVADYLTTPALYRREALAAVGGYDVRLSSEEDFELGLRLRRHGRELRSLGQLAARHWSAPRPSLAELGRRWASGLCFGQGQVLRLYVARPGFLTLLRRQSLYVATLAMWGLGLLAAGAALAGAGGRGLALWAPLPVAVLLLMSARKRSARLALYSLATWTLNGLGLLVGFCRPPAAPARPPDTEEAAC